MADVKVERYLCGDYIPFWTVAAELHHIRQSNEAAGFTAEYDDHVGPGYLASLALDFVDQPLYRDGLLQAASLLIDAIECMDRAAAGSAEGSTDAG